MIRPDIQKWLETGDVDMVEGLNRPLERENIEYAKDLTAKFGDVFTNYALESEQEVEIALEVDLLGPDTRQLGPPDDKLLTLHSHRYSVMKSLAKKDLDPELRPIMEEHFEELCAQIEAREKELDAEWKFKRSVTD